MKAVIISAAFISALALALTIKRLPGRRRDKKVTAFIFYAAFFLTFFGVPVQILSAPKHSGYNRPATKSIIQLRKSQSWQHFKRFWKKLDAIETTGNETLYISEYNNALSPRQAASCKKELTAVYKELISLTKQSGSGINKLEIDILYAITVRRINYLSTNRDKRRIMIMHTMPEPALRAYDFDMIQLEKKIDILLKLKEAGNIDQSQLQQVIKNITNQIMICSVQHIFTSSHTSKYIYSHNYNNNDPLLKQLRDRIENLEKREQKTRQETELYLLLKKTYKSAQQIHPHLLQLVHELEQ